MKLFSFKKINTHVRLLFKEAEAFKDTASKPEIMVSMSSSLLTDVNISALWVPAKNHEEKWKTVEEFLNLKTIEKFANHEK